MRVKINPFLKYFGIITQQLRITIELRGVTPGSIKAKEAPSIAETIRKKILPNDLD
tara:strand:+ start:490 stop:657 length:168 start_codon:yes stop_codon:yes gene_type:complete